MATDSHLEADQDAVMKDLLKREMELFRSEVRGEIQLLRDQVQELQRTVEEITRRMDQER